MRTVPPAQVSLIDQARYFNVSSSNGGERFMLSPFCHLLQSAVVGPFDASLLSPTVLTSSRDAESRIDELRALLTKDNLKIMTGGLSESDLKLIQKISAAG